MPQAARLGDLIGHTPTDDSPNAGGGHNETGKITGPCSENVFTNGINAARAQLDKTVCSKHDQARPPIATGSSTVYINGFPAARMGDKSMCSAVITTGSGNVFIGGPTTQTAVIISDEVLPPIVNEILEMAKNGAALVLGAENEVAYSGAGDQLSKAGATVALKAHSGRFTIGEQSFYFKGGTSAERVQAEKDLRSIFKTKRGAKMLATLEARRTLFGTKKEFGIDLSVRDTAWARIGSDMIHVDPKYHHDIETTQGTISMSTRRMFAHELGHAVMNAPVEHGPRGNRMFNVMTNENPIMKELGEPERTKYDKDD